MRIPIRNCISIRVCSSWDVKESPQTTMGGHCNRWLYVFDSFALSDDALVSMITEMGLDEELYVHVLVCDCQTMP
jgi:hypothetical protein